jgi:hypothetical protein
MKAPRFKRIVEWQVTRCLDTLIVKAAEYATEDRLHNFKVAAEVQGTTPRQALMGMMAKHTVSIYDMGMSDKSFPIGMWDEKITDHINYLLLLKALVVEESRA